MDVRGLVEGMVQGQNFQRVINNPLAQFGPTVRPYLGATLLPERNVPENAYTEEAIKYRTIVANDGTRYSPVQIKNGILSGSFEVRLGESDQGSHFTGADYDALIRLIEQTTGTQGVAGGGVDRPSMMAIAQLTQWSDATLNLPLMEKNEKQRWEAIVGASITRQGDNGYQEVVNFSNPTGHRVNAGGTWSNNSYDPWADIIAGAEFLAAKGYTVNRIITGTDVRSKLTNNSQVKLRAGHLNVSGSTVTGIPGRVTLSRLNDLLSDDGLPPIELYDLQYRTNTSSGYFFPRGTFAMICTTGRDQSIDRGDLEPVIIPNTLGYQAVGRSAGQSAPGRVIKVRAIDDSKPPRIEGEAWQTGLPVVLEPEAIFIIKSIS